MVTRGSTNVNMRKLISSLIKTQKDVWKRIASDLERPRRIRRTVNLTRINRHVNEGETAVIAGKVLGEGVLDKKISVAAFQFSDSAKAKIEAAGGSVLTLSELIKKNPDAKGVRVIG